MAIANFPGDPADSLKLHPKHLGQGACGIGDEFVHQSEHGMVVEYEAVYVLTQNLKISIQSYLDECIVKWRQIRDNDQTDPVMRKMAPIYINAFQSVRSSIIGSLLPGSEEVLLSNRTPDVD